MKSQSLKTDIKIPANNVNESDEERIRMSDDCKSLATIYIEGEDYTKRKSCFNKQLCI